MERGWGLTLDSDSLRLFSPSTVHRPPTGFLKVLGQNSRPRAADALPTMLSSAHLGHRPSEQEPDSVVSLPLSAGKNRPAVEEVDFFSADSKNRSSPPAQEPSAAATAIKKESEACSNVNVSTRNLKICPFVHPSNKTTRCQPLAS